MSLTNPKNVITEERLSEFYQQILPYLGGSADAGFTPVGTVISVMGVNAPANYLACNGQTVNIVDYPELANYFYQQFGSKNKFGGDGVTTFGIPDLRGEFLRGTGTNSHYNTDAGIKEGNGAAVGTHQASTTINAGFAYAGSTNTGKLAIRGNANADGNLALLQNVDAYKTADGSATYKQLLTPAGTVQNSPNTAVQYGTVKPTNTSVLYCIATKNIYLNPSLDYSTDEKIVGTWIDGKPLYQKTVRIQTPTISTDGTGAQRDIDISSLNVSYGFVVDGALDNGNPINTAWGTTNASTTAKYYFRIGIYIPGEHIFVQSNRSSISDIYGYVTIRYTKTTD